MRASEFLSIVSGRLPPSAADLLLGSELQGLAIDFTDLSMTIRDTTTPANNYQGSPASKLTGLPAVDPTGLLVTGTPNIYLDTSAFPFNHDEVTFFCKLITANAAGISFEVPVCFNNAGNFGAGPGAMLRLASNTSLQAGGNSTSATATGTISNGVPAKIAGTFNDVTNKQAAVINGGTVASNTTTDWTGTDSTRLQIASLNQAGAQAALRVRIQQLLVLPRAMSDAEIQALTA